MKLEWVVDVVEETFDVGRRRRSGRIGALVALGSSLLLASPGWALDGIDLSAPSEPAGEEAEASTEGECSRLIQIKYPFLSCANGQIGLADADATWENSRQIPRGFDWVEGGGYFGPPQNQRDRDNE